MQIQSICLVLAIALLFSNARSEWVHMEGSSGNVTCSTKSGTNLFLGTEGGIFLSTNNGTSWIHADSGLTNTRVWSLAVMGTNPIAGSDDGVFRSTNNGTSWMYVLTPAHDTLEGPWLFPALAVIGQNIFAGACSYLSMMDPTINGLI